MLSNDIRYAVLNNLIDLGADLGFTDLSSFAKSQSNFCPGPPKSPRRWRDAKRRSLAPSFRELLLPPGGPTEDDMSAADDDDDSTEEEFDEEDDMFGSDEEDDEDGMDDN